jgi:hypothetical protein
MNTYLCTHTHGHVDSANTYLKYQYQAKTTHTISCPFNFVMKIMGRQKTCMHL